MFNSNPRQKGNAFIPTYSEDFVFHFAGVLSSMVLAAPAPEKCTRFVPESCNVCARFCLEEVCARFVRALG